MASLVSGLIGDGHIPAAKVRHELQDVHPLTRGFVVEGSPGAPAPSLRLERAAMIYLGMPSYGVHVNGWVRKPPPPPPPPPRRTNEEDETTTTTMPTTSVAAGGAVDDQGEGGEDEDGEEYDDGRPWGMWVAKRSMSKATYAGLLDQMVAGGQPSGMTFAENVRKECEEEASLPPDVLRRVKQTGLVSYRYATAKGLSTKVLATYDLELPHGLLPICADGEVDEFRLMPIPEVLRSIREELPLWKPNSAMVVVDFAIRHGFVDFDDPNYMEIAHLLRTGGLA